MANEQRATNIHPRLASIHLVKATPNRGLIEKLEWLLEGAKRGEVTGIAFAASLGGMRFLTDSAGSCYEHPTFARGCVLALSDELAALQHSRDESEAR